MTTDEMDGIFTEEDKKHKYDIYIQCKACLEWKFSDYRKLGELKCDCGGRGWNYRELTSFRTYDPIRLKKRKRR